MGSREEGNILYRDSRDYTSVPYSLLATSKVLCLGFRASGFSFEGVEP